MGLSRLLELVAVSVASQGTITCQNNATTYRKYEHTQFHSGMGTQTQPNCALSFLSLNPSSFRVVPNNINLASHFRNIKPFDRHEMKTMYIGAATPARTTCCFSRKSGHDNMSKQCNSIQKVYEHTQFHSGMGTQTQTDCAYIFLSLNPSSFKGCTKQSG